MKLARVPKALYVESSALGRAYLHADHQAAAALHSAARGRSLYTSRLTLVELQRVIAALARTGRLTPAQEADIQRRLARVLGRIHVLALSEPVLARAIQPFPVEPVGTLDAIHLATALYIERELADDLVVIAHDQAVRQNATELSLALA